MNNTFFISELASKPACTITTIEQYVFNKFMELHPDEASSLMRSQHPTADLGFLNAPRQCEPKVQTGRELVFGLKGLAELLNCSVVTASRIKSSGTLDKATSQIGRKLVFDKNLVLELTHTKKGVSCHA